MPLEGTLHYLDIAHLFRVVGGAQKSGVLEITWDDRRARMKFERGRLTNAESNRFRQGIGTILVQAGYLTEHDLERALEVQRSEGSGARRLGGILCDEFGVRPEDIERQLRHQFELIAFDVFSWPGGRFTFEFREPEAVHDRFHVDPVEFILAVGIEAGLLAEEGIGRQEAVKVKRHVLFLEEDPALLSRYRDHWQRKGFWVMCCDAAREFAGYLTECGGDLPIVVVSDDCHAHVGRVGGGLAVVEAVTAAHPGIAAVVVGEKSSDLFARAQEAGAVAAVERPSPRDLAGPEAEARLSVFFVALERAIDSARERVAENAGTTGT
jgi:hypothetical protein